MNSGRYVTKMRQSFSFHKPCRSSYDRHFFKHQFGSRASIENPRGWVFSLSFGFFPWVFEFFPWVFENFNLRTCFFLDFWKINQNISKIFPLLKIFGNKNGIFRGNPENLFQRWVFFLSFTNLSKVDPRGWVFSLSFLLEFCPWVLVFSAADVKKKPGVDYLSTDKGSGLSFGSHFGKCVK